MSLIRKHVAVLQAWACLALVVYSNAACESEKNMLWLLLFPAGNWISAARVQRVRQSWIWDCRQRFLRLDCALVTRSPIQRT